MSALPYGTSTYSRGWPAFGTDAPLYVTHGDGWRTFDAQGNDYADLIMGLGSVILGHRNSVVDEAIRRQLCFGTAFSLGSYVELEAASRLLMHFPDFCQVQWAVNGSDATEGACRLARLVTGRDVICMAADSYHGFHDWCLADSSRGNGIPTGDCEGNYNVLPLDLNGYMTSAEGKHYTAGVIVEPDLHPDWLKPIREWCSAHGALMICDEVMTWQRYPEWTASAHHGVVPDLWCLGKSLGNGLPVSAIIGSRDILRRFAPSLSASKPNAFFSSTWAGHPLSMAAVIATLDVMERENGPAKLWGAADKLYDALPVQPYIDGLLTRGGVPWNRCTWKTPTIARVWRKLMAEHGVLIYASHNLSLAHDQNAIHRLLEAWKNAVRLLPERLASAGESDELETTGVMRR